MSIITENQVIVLTFRLISYTLLKNYKAHKFNHFDCFTFYFVSSIFNYHFFMVCEVLLCSDCILSTHLQKLAFVANFTGQIVGTHLFTHNKHVYVCTLVTLFCVQDCGHLTGCLKWLNVYSW